MRGAALAALIVLFAGCADGTSETEAPDESFDEFELDDTSDELGVIRGIVVDPAITPVAGAWVELSSSGLNTTTNKDGAFVFKDLPAGTYFLDATKPGYSTVQTSTQVEAGVKEPPVVKILIERLPGTEPSIMSLQFDGHITCSARIPTGFATGCLLSIAVGDLGNDRRDFEVESGNVEFMQTEAIWTKQSDLATNMCLRVYGYGHDDVCGPTGILQGADEAGAKANGLGAGTPIEVVLYVDFFVEPVFGLAVEQPFQAFTHVFYNWAPPEGWAFSVDDEPTPPS